MSQSYESRFERVGHEYNAAGSKYPLARENERNGLLSRLFLGPGLTILDAPAGGGYVADGIKAFQPDVNIICVEPSKNFSLAIPAIFERLNEPLDKIPLQDSSIDAVASLAGLHHIPCRTSVFREWYRLLKLEGQVVVADVAVGTEVDAFLNGFVNTHSPDGHEGLFFEANDFTLLFENNGFEVISDHLCSVPWVFTGEEEMVDFCKHLFAVHSASDTEILRALEKIGVSSEGQKVFLHWELQYAEGRKLAEH